MAFSLNKSQILDRIKEEKSFSGYGSDRLLADFLGIDPTKLANWRTRGGLNFQDVLEKCYDLDLQYIITGKKPELCTYFEVVEAVKVIEEICFEKEINDITEIKPRMVVVALKKQKKLGKPWSDMKDIMETAIEVAVDQTKNEIGG